MLKLIHFQTILFFIFWILAPQFVYAGAWLVPEKSWESYHNITYYSTDRYTDFQGNEIDQPRYGKIENGHRLEYGLNSQLTVGASLALARVTGSQNSAILGGAPSNSTNLGISDPTLYARHALYSKNHSIISAQGSFKLPSHFADSTAARTGSDEISFEARILAGQSFQWRNNHFANAEIGYEYRPNNNGDLLHIDLTTGFRITPEWIIMPQVFSTWNLGDETGTFTQTGNDAYDLVKPQISAVYQLNSMLSIQTGVFHHAYARNSGGGSGATIALWVQP